MDHRIRRHRAAMALVLVAAVGSAISIGVWEASPGRSVEPVAAAAQRSVFVQSGGVAGDASVPPAEQVFAHRPGSSEVAASTF